MFLPEPLCVVAMPQKAIELPFFFFFGTWILFVINIWEKNTWCYPVFILFRIKCLTSFCFWFYVRNILSHVLKDFVFFFVCLFVLHSVNLNIILWLGGVEKILDWPEMKLSVLTDSSGSCDTHLHSPAKGFPLWLWCIDFEALLTTLAVCPEPTCPV